MTKTSSRLVAGNQGQLDRQSPDSPTIGQRVPDRNDDQSMLAQSLIRICPEFLKLSQLIRSLIMKLSAGIFISASIFGSLACNTTSKNSTIKDDAVAAAAEFGASSGIENGVFMAQVFVDHFGPDAQLTNLKILGKFLANGQLVQSAVVAEGNGDQFNIRLPNGYDRRSLISVAQLPNGEDTIVFKGQLSRSNAGASSDPFGTSLPGFSLDADLETHRECPSASLCSFQARALMSQRGAEVLPDERDPGGPSVRIPNTQPPGRGTFATSFSMLAPRLVESASPLMPIAINTARVTVVSNCNISKVNGILVGDPNLRSMKAGTTSAAFDGNETTWTSFTPGKRLSISALSIVVANNTRQQLNCAFHIYKD